MSTPAAHHRLVALGALLLIARLRQQSQDGGPARRSRLRKSPCTKAPSLLHSQYTLVQHLWIDSWRSNWTFPRFSTEAEGLEAMKRAASDAGANGLLHAICVDGASKASDKADAVLLWRCDQSELIRRRLARTRLARRAARGAHARIRAVPNPTAEETA